MQIFTDDMQTGTAGNFNFSGVRPEKLGAAEYTLVTLVMDRTGSVNGFEADLLRVKRAVVEACRKAPRAEYLMLRSVEVNERVDVHGFVELVNIDPSKYRAPNCKGSTALFDATYSAVAATNEYARTLADNDFSVNGIVIVVTDGDDNVSAQTVKNVAKEIKRGVQNEWLESLNVVLVGVNATCCKKHLDVFYRNGGLTQYVDVGDATPQKLARLADFISRSITSQSQSLGTGGPSQALTF
ncbi:MAG: hypothetical protein HQK55_03835 [Deltaproteobacteria bacterium]|nr:hypothetical protein [Deltaproteobacteria bacterium]